ncbi:MAG: hypothetical protein EXS10_02290 [Phycisphaerales bacterium]|nr:hypothetical protein [Phycisphaerales bacterium]
MHDSSASLRVSRALLALSAACACLQLASADVQLDLRDGAALLEGSSAIVEESGLRVKRVDGVDQFVRWDQVRAVRGTTAPANIDAQLKGGETLWRGRMRLLRGDYELAEPLLREVWGSMRVHKGDLASITAEGLLRCALARGDMVGALEPWIIVAENAATHATSADAPFASLPGVLEPSTLFSSGITPFAADETATRAAEALDSAAREATKTALMAQRFARLLRNAPQHVALASDAPLGEQLLASLEELALATDDRERKKLADGFLALARTSGGGDAPRELLAWRSMTIGRALVQRAESSAREEGTLELLSVAATQGNTALGRLALHEAAAACRERGDAKSASTIERIGASYDGDPFFTDSKQKSAAAATATESDRKQTP